MVTYTQGSIPPPAPRWSPGGAVLLRDVWRGRVWSAVPVTVVCDTPALVALAILPGTRRMRPLRPDGLRLGVGDVLAGNWTPTEKTWTGGSALILCLPGAGHALVGFWEDGHRALANWYINLQEPLRRSPLGFDTLDHVLDLVVSADRRSWSWKDEDVFAEAEAAGLFDAATAAAIRAEGKRALGLLLEGSPPYAPSWERWVPDPAWPVPTLPLGWDAVSIP